MGETYGVALIHSKKDKFFVTIYQNKSNSLHHIVK